MPSGYASCVVGNEHVCLNRKECFDIKNVVHQREEVYMEYISDNGNIRNSGLSGILKFYNFSMI